MFYISSNKVKTEATVAPHTHTLHFFKPINDQKLSVVKPNLGTLSLLLVYSNH